MTKFIKLSKYHIVVIGIYLVVVPFLIFLVPYRLSYGVSNNNIESIILFFIFAFVSLFFWKPIKISNLKGSSVFSTILYASLFAFPEEILFRGIIQNFFEIHVGGLAVLISSFIFGAAHLLNGAKSVNLKNWNWQFTILVFFAGLPLGSLFLITNSLLLPTLLHIIFLEEMQLSNSREILKIKERMYPTTD